MGHRRIGYRQALAGVTVTLAALLGTSSHAFATHVRCGDTITQDMTLDSDLIGCSANSAALRIEAHDVTLDLNGHRIVAAEPPEFVLSNGIANWNGYDRLTIRNGTVEGFVYGVRIGQGSGNEVARSTGNLIADLTTRSIYAVRTDETMVVRTETSWISLNGSHNTVSDNEAHETGISVHGSGNTVVRNHSVSSSPFSWGVSIGGDHSLAADNVVDGSGAGLGFFPTGPGVEMRGNRVSVNGPGLGARGPGEIVENEIESRAGNGVHFHLSDGGLGARNIVLRGNSIRAGPESAGIIGLVPEQVTIEGNSISGGRVGIELTDSLFVHVVDNKVEGNGEVGISMLQGYGPLIEGNQISGYGDGIRLEDGIRRGVLSENRVNASVDDGIDIDEPQNTVTRNEAFRNGDWGIEAVPGTVDGGGNRAWSNGQPAQCLNVVCGPGPAASVELTPAEATNPVNTEHCVTSTALDPDGRPVTPVEMRFEVGGGLAGNIASGTSTTDTSGRATFCYTGPSLGPSTDLISAHADTDGDAQLDAGELAGQAHKHWVPPPAGDDCRISAVGRLVTSDGASAALRADVRTAAGTTSGRITYSDAAARISLRSTSLHSAMCDRSTGSASVFSEGRNGSGTVLFRIDVEDRSGHRDETVRVRLSDGYDSGYMNLASGRLRVR